MVYSGQQISPLKALMRKLACNYNSCVLIKLSPFVTGFVTINPNHTGTEIHFIAEH